MYFDASTLAKNAALEPTGFANEIDNKICTGAFEFRNGSLLCCSSIASQAAGRTKPVRLLFDNSEWRPANGGDFVFNWTDQSYVKVNVEGTGLILNVPGSAVWTVNTPVNGSGGLVKKGEGTLLLGEDAISYSGVTRIDEGLLDLGGKAHALRVSGPGTVAGGVIAGGGMCISLGDDGTPDGPLPKFRDVAFAGRFKVDLGRDGAGQSPDIPGKTVKIAEYEGGSIDVSRWRVVNAGRKNVSGNFEAKDGSVYMTLDNAGLSLIVR
jgi:autotransporter-associated beta strand protein